MRIQQKVRPDFDHSYTVAYPTGYSDDPTVQYPLVLALHFAGHGSPFYGRLFLDALVAPAFESLGAIILAPDCTAASWEDPKSETDVLNLLEYVVNHYPVNRKRVLVVGYSMGGNGAWFLAAQHPQLFCAAVVLSGWPPAEVTSVDWKVPLYIIHSRDDEFVPLATTQRTVNSLLRRGVEVEFRILEGITHFETYNFIEPLKKTIPWIQQRWNSMN